MSLVRSGVMTLPPGFRFHPTDEELVAQYLRRKVMSYPVPASIISEVEVCKADPWDLPGVKGGEEMYFFSTREAKYPNGNRSNRATVSGFWKATGKDKAIVVGIIPRPVENKEEDDEVARIETVVVGMKKTLVFYRGKPPHGCRTDWIMHEYRLANYPQPPSPPTPPSSAAADNNNNAGHEKRGGGMIMKDWVLCRIFLKKRNSSRNNEDEGEEQVEEERNNNNNNGNNNNNNDDDGGRDLDDENKVVGVGRRTRNSKKRNGGDPVYYDFLQTKKKKKTRRDGGGGKGGCGGRSKRGEWLSTDLNLSPCLSSSGSSGVTAEVYDGCFNNESADEKEESSSCNSFASFTKKT